MIWISVAFNVVVLCSFLYVLHLLGKERESRLEQHGRYKLENFDLKHRLEKYEPREKT